MLEFLIWPANSSNGASTTYACLLFWRLDVTTAVNYNNNKF